MYTNIYARILSLKLYGFKVCRFSKFFTFLNTKSAKSIFVENDFLGLILAEKHDSDSLTAKRIIFDPFPDRYFTNSMFLTVLVEKGPCNFQNEK